MTCTYRKVDAWFLVRWDRGFALLRRPYPRATVILSRAEVFERFEKIGQGTYVPKASEHEATTGRGGGSPS
jgi:hypothetical protein